MLVSSGLADDDGCITDRIWLIFDLNLNVIYTKSPETIIPFTSDIYRPNRLYLPIEIKEGVSLIVPAARK